MSVLCIFVSDLSYFVVWLWLLHHFITRIANRVNHQISHAPDGTFVRNTYGGRRPFRFRGEMIQILNVDFPRGQSYRFLIVGFVVLVPVSLPRIVVFDIHTQEEIDATIAFPMVLRDFWLQLFQQINEITFQIEVLLPAFELHLLNHTIKGMFLLHDKKGGLDIHDIRAMSLDRNLLSESWSECVFDDFSAVSNCWHVPPFIALWDLHLQLCSHSITLTGMPSASSWNLLSKSIFALSSQKIISSSYHSPIE